MNLINRCNRSVPHIEVVSIAIDVLINIARVNSTKDYLAGVPNLVHDLFQIMMVYRDHGGTIFSKICALLHILSKTATQTRAELLLPQNKQRLLDHQTRISTKQKHKEQSQKRRTCGAGGTMLPPAPLKKSTANASVLLDG